MNRQQRRQMARQRAVEQKYMEQLVENQWKVDERQTTAFLICFALAVHEAYGWGQVRLARGMGEFNKQLLRLNAGDTLEDLRNDLEERTGIFIKLDSDRIRIRKGK